MLASVVIGHPADAADPSPISGPVSVKDGDTWRIHTGGKRIEIRPAGIDAPELSQICLKDDQPWFAGWASGRWLAEYLHGHVVTCHPTGERSYGRVVANCTVDGADLQAAIVAAGWAFDYPRYSNGRFADVEASARAAGLGIWQGTCEKPWQWRREHQ